MADRYYRYFGNPCPGRVNPEAHNWIEIYNSSYILRSANKGWPTGNNNKSYRQQVEEFLHRSNVSEWLTKKKKKKKEIKHNGDFNNK